MRRPAARVEPLGSESAFSVLKRARELEAQGRDIVHVEIGQPDFNTPAHIVQAAYKAIRAGETGYAPTMGLPEMRDAAALDASKRRGIQVDPDDVIVANGAKPLLFFAILACVETGAEVLCPNPGFPIYESVVRMAGGKPVPYYLKESRRFRFDIDQFQDALTDRTAMIILNSPHNPTGGTLSKTELKAVADAATDRGIWVLSDEVYGRLTYGEPHESVLSFDGMRARTIMVDGASKAYAMTGWRLGWAVLPPALKTAFELLTVNSNSCAPPFTQRAGAAALNGPQDCVQRMRLEFARRRKIVVDGLNAIDGIECASPQGAFYAFPNIRRLGNDKQIADRLLEEAGVASLWGSSFGEGGAGHLRISYAAAVERLEEALRRIRRFAEKTVRAS